VTVEAGDTFVGNFEETRDEGEITDLKTEQREPRRGNGRRRGLNAHRERQWRARFAREGGGSDTNRKLMGNVFWLTVGVATTALQPGPQGRRRHS
jgi:hypothetical protein